MFTRSVILAFFVFALAIAPARTAENGCSFVSSLITWDEPCGNRNATFTDQCKKSEVNTQCTITATACGCVITYADGSTEEVGFEDCNPCVPLVDEPPPFDEDTCFSEGSITFEGDCTSRGYTMTRECKTIEKGGVDSAPKTCDIEAAVCGCFYWETEDRINAVPYKKCDPCKSGSASLAAGTGLLMASAVLVLSSLF